MSEILTNSHFLNVLCGTVIGGLVAVIAWLLFGKGVSGNGESADDAGEQLDRAGEQQSAAAGALERVESGLSASQGTVSEIAGTGADLAETVNGIAGRESECDELIKRSGELIESSHDILRGLRKGTPED